MDVAANIRRVASGQLLRRFSVTPPAAYQYPSVQCT
jgi:hypothetical protein